MKIIFSKHELQNLIDDVVELAEKFRNPHLEAINASDLHAVLTNHRALPATNNDQIENNALLLTPALQQHFIKRAEIFRNYQHRGLSEEARDQILRTVHADIAHEIAKQINLPEITNHNDKEAKFTDGGVYKSALADLKAHHDKAELKNQTASAPDILYIARDVLQKQKDYNEHADNSILIAVDMFKRLYGIELTESQAWQFMSLITMADSSLGGFNRDNYQAQATYSALAGEAAGKEQKAPGKEH